MCMYRRTKMLGPKGGSEQEKNQAQNEKKKKERKTYGKEQEPFRDGNNKVHEDNITP